MSWYRNLQTTIAFQVAAGETVILLHRPLPLAGVSTGMRSGRQQNDSTLADGYFPGPGQAAVGPGLLGVPG